MADLETDLRGGGINYFDSGGTYDPHLTGPTEPFGPHAPEQTEMASISVALRTPVARAVHAATWLVFGFFVIGALFFLEPLSTIFFH